MWIEVKVL